MMADSGAIDRKAETNSHDKKKKKKKERKKHGSEERNKTKTRFEFNTPKRILDTSSLQG